MANPSWPPEEMRMKLRRKKFIILADPRERVIKCHLESQASTRF